MATYYVQTVAQGDESGDSEANAFTMATACDTVAADDLVHVKANATYTVQDGANDCIMHITTAGASGTPIHWKGYKTTIDDGGIVKIDANTNTLASAAKTAITGNVYNVLENFDFQGGSSHGLDGNGGVDDNIAFKNCRFYNNGGSGVIADNNCKFINCIASNNTADGFECDTNTLYVACVAHTNVIGFEASGIGVAYNCLAYNNSSHDYSNAGGTFILLGDTSDCEGAANDYCYNLLGADNNAVVNCIAHDGDYGINASADKKEMVISAFNVFNSSNTADVNNWLATSTGDGTGNRGDVVDPANMFLDEANDDYTPHASGGMLGVGIDAYFCQQFWADYNDGAGDNPPAE